MVPQTLVNTVTVVFPELSVPQRSVSHCVRVNFPELSVPQRNVSHCWSVFPELSVPQRIVSTVRIVS